MQSPFVCLHRIARALCLTAGALVGLGAAAGAAEADQDVLVRWSHPQPSLVDGFRIHTRTEGAAHDTGTDVGLPALGLDGRYEANIPIPEGVQVYIRLSAYNSVGASPLSTRENGYLVETGGETLGKPGRPVLVIE